MLSRREVCLLFGSIVGDVHPSAAAALVASRDGLQRTHPVTAGVDPRAVIAFLDACAVAGFELDSFMLYRAGGVVAEGWWWPYRPELPHMLHSATKSFTATAIGLAIAEGRLSLDDRIVDLFPDRVAHPGEHLREMRVRHLLAQTSGHAIGISGSQWRPLHTSWIDEFLKVPVPYRPGTHFAYSSATSYMLSAILTRVTGQTAQRYLRPRLFEPMAMHAVRWDLDRGGVNPGGNGLSTTTADLLKLGILYLAGGTWRGRRLIPEAWIAAATRPQGATDYGYHWWLMPDGLGYFAAGKFGQFCFVFPALDIVLAITAGVADNAETRARMHALAINGVPAMVGGTAGATTAGVRLRERCSELRLLPAVPGPPAPPAAVARDGRYACDANVDGVVAIALRFGRDFALFRMIDARGEHIVRCGVGRWIEGETTITGGYLHHEYQPARMRVVAGGAWRSADQFEMTWQFVESGFRDTVTLAFTDDRLTYDRGVNVNSGPLARPTITAVRAQP